jgi:hypothetical protein
MARQAAQAKMGFYPIDPFCMDAIIGHLAVSTTSGSRGVHVIDPCCGEGAALKQIADGLQIPADQVYGIELDEARATKAKEAIPGAKIVGPASIFGMRMTGHSFSLAYVNPPFDHELGGGQRQEYSFVEESWRLLTRGGVMVLVCPLTALNENRNFCRYIDSRFEDVRIFTYPDGISRTTGWEYRRFNEIVVIGKKRGVLLTDEMIPYMGALHIAEFEWRNKNPWINTLSRIHRPEYFPHSKGRPMSPVAAITYHLPGSWKPTSFHKSEYLPHELVAALASSPLNTLTREVEAVELARPPIAPGKGHVALLLASGQLDGVVEGEGEEPHVIRGGTRKVEYYNEAASTSEENPDTGELTTKDVYSQKPVCVIRVAWQDGTIMTLSDTPENATDEAPQEPESNEHKGDFPDDQEPRGKTGVKATAKGNVIIIEIPDRPSVLDKLVSIVRATGDLRTVPPWEG